MIVPRSVVSLPVRHRPRWWIAGWLLLIGLLATGCSGGGLLGGPTPTVLPFNRLAAQPVLDAFNRAGLGVQNVRRDMLIGRDAPATFSDRYIFEIASIAPNGGQVLVFNTPADLAAWEDYITGLRADPTTRRAVIYVYTHANVLIQVNAALTNQQADAFRTALLGL